MGWNRVVGAMVGELVGWVVMIPAAVLAVGETAV